MAESALRSRSPSRACAGGAVTSLMATASTASSLVAACRMWFAVSHRGTLGRIGTIGSTDWTGPGPGFVFSFTQMSSARSGGYR